MSTQSQLKTYQQMDTQEGRERPAAQGGYQQAPRAGSPTYTEAWALVEAARRMAAAIQGGPVEETETKRRIRDTLRLNWRLWTIFQSELTTSPGQVPEEIRMNMLNLCQFVDKHTIDAIADTTPEKVAVLIDMNRNIASGLLESLQEGNQAAVPEVPQAAATTEPAAPSEDALTNIDQEA